MDDEIVRDIVWTPRAARSFNQVITYLQKEWSDKEVEQIKLFTEFEVPLKNCILSLIPFAPIFPIKTDCNIFIIGLRIFMSCV